MCTAATYKTKDFYIGRTLDYEFSYGDEITITPRNYEFKFKEKETIKKHYAIIGMAYIAENYPLYYDAINEKGLGIAGLNFVGNTHYNEKKNKKRQHNTIRIYTMDFKSMCNSKRSKKTNRKNQFFKQAIQ